MQLRPPPLPALLSPGAAEVRADALPPPARSPRSRRSLRSTRCRGTHRCPTPGHEKAPAPATHQPCSGCSVPPAPALLLSHHVPQAQHPHGHRGTCETGSVAMDSRQRPRPALARCASHGVLSSRPAGMQGCPPALCWRLSPGLVPTGQHPNPSAHLRDQLPAPGPTTPPAHGSFTLGSCTAKRGGTRCSSLPRQDESQPCQDHPPPHTTCWALLGVSGDGGRVAPVGPCWRSQPCPGVAVAQRHVCPRQHWPCHPSCANKAQRHTSRHSPATVLPAAPERHLLWPSTGIPGTHQEPAHGSWPDPHLASRWERRDPKSALASC